VSEFFEARIHVESQDWTFGAHQAASRAAAAEELVALRRQYRHLAEPELVELAGSWRRDDVSGPYFVFAAAALGGEVAVSATFLKALFHELGDEAAAGLGGLLEQWSEQRRYARESGQQPVAGRPPRVAALLPRDPRRWAPESWQPLSALGLDAPEFDATTLSWDSESGAWLLRSPD
jgi:hypothetical protein